MLVWITVFRFPVSALFYLFVNKHYFIMLCVSLIPGQVKFPGIDAVMHPTLRLSTSGKIHQAMASI